MDEVIPFPAPQQRRERMRDRHANPHCRRIISGVAYDTDTASVVAQVWEDETFEYAINGPQHPYEVGQVLYKNLWDQFFLYLYDDSGEEEGVDGIRPLTRAEAIEWCEGHFHHYAVDIEDIFGKFKEAGEGAA